MFRLGGWSPARRLRAKFVLLALLPLLGALGLMALAVSHQDRDLAERERVLVLQTYMNARRVELRHYVDLAVSTVRPLYDSGQTDPATRQQAIQRLASLDYGSDGYFFVYDLDGEVLMHSRQPELLGRNLWNLRDPRGQPTIQQLIAQARQGGGYVEYLWQKPSSGKMVPKLGYVVALPRWHLMLGTGLYLDDMDDTLTQLDQQVRGNISATLWWMLGIAGLALLCLSVSGLWLNLSEQRIADQKLRLLAQRLVRSQEDERARLARELHDGSSQTLVSTKLLLESALHAVQHGGPPPEHSLRQALARLGDSLTEIRRLSHRLRPAMLDRLGLPAALEQLVAEWSEASGVAAQVFVGPQVPELGEEVKTALFRVAQEALANVAKHAGAQQVQLSLLADTGSPGAGPTLHLQISDDGRGFEAERLHHDPQQGIGLRNIRERMAAVGGSVEFLSAPGQGTQLDAQVPLGPLTGTGTGAMPGFTQESEG